MKMFQLPHVCQRLTPRYPLHCVVPPYLEMAVLTVMLSEGNENQRRNAIQSLEHGTTIRFMRALRNENRGSDKTIREFDRVKSRKARQRLLGRRRATTPNCEKHRFIYNAGNTLKIPGSLVRREGDAPSADREVNEAFDGLGFTYDLFCSEYDRDSLDDRGMELNATVHFSDGYDNAYWDGERMVFGDGDADLFNPFTRSVDVIAHELAHGVTEFTAKLAYVGQSGALNESISDVFGSLVKQYMLRETAAEADWIIGEGLLTNNVNGVGIRSMAEPGTAYNDPVLGKDPQPAHMDDFVRTLSDNFGVHINSGIPNHAFYLAATRLGGFAWEKAGLIWYLALLDPALSRFAQFQDFAQITLDAACDAFGRGSEEYLAVGDAWASVGVL